MKVTELIEELEKVHNKEIEVQIYLNKNDVKKIDVEAKRNPAFVVFDITTINFEMSDAFLIAIR